MSQTIDSRVVEMRFDNKQFESGAKQSMSTLGKLKEALKLPESGKALENLGKAAKDIKLDGIASGIATLEKRFSTLGIVGMRVIENITDGLMNKLKNAVGFVTDSIISGGIKRAMNIENAHFQLQALLKDETKVQAVMADAMESVDGTAYAYDEAAKAASQFAASGIEAGEDMLNALKGITGVAAMTNSSFEDISRVFTTVAGNGRLMGDQLLQLSSRGLNAASTLADYFREVRGQSSMTEAEIRDMVSKGKISFKDFSDAMTWAFGDSAKRANETFTGAMSNMKSALARIGAGFISPLVEQNGEVVQLFNALRIKINDVKSALVFDEQRSAIDGLTKSSNLFFDSMSGIVKNGSVGFDEITTAILGTSKSEKELSEINEKLSETYEQVKESGSASVDTLVEFNKNGINATQAIQKYINGVLDGTIRVSDSVKKSVEEITSGAKIGSGAVTKLAEEGKISYDIFTDAVVYSSDVVNKESKFASEAVSNMMKTVKESGKVTTDTLLDFNKQGMNAAVALRKYMNGVQDGTIRASYATKQAIEAITEGTEVASGDILKFAEEGKIGYDIFQSAMEEFYGEEKTLSKQFTDSFLDMTKKIVTAINEMDMTKPMAAFYNIVESVKNVLKGLFSILKPVGQAFADVFLSFDADGVVSFTAAIERMTSKLKLSEKGSKNLHDAFKGVFDVVKLLVDIFFKLLGAILPINKPIVEMGGGLLSLFGAIGRGLSSFTEMIRSCKLLKQAFSVLSDGFSLGMGALSKLIKIGKDFISTLSKMEGTTRLVNAISSAFERLGSKAVPYITDFVNEAEELFKSLFHLEDLNVDKVLETISQAFSDLAWEIEHFSFKTIENAFDTVRKKIEEFKKLFTGNEGLMTFVTNAKKFGTDLNDALTWDALMERLETIMNVFGKFFNWIKETMAPAFADFNFGSVLASGGGIGIIYAMIKAAKALEKFASSDIVSNISGLFGSVKNTLLAYQKELKAEALLKTAAAIAVLAGALVILSFADTERILQASIALSLIAGVLMLGISKLLDAVNKGKEVSNALTIFAKGFSKALKKLATAVQIKAIGSAIKDVGKTILMIAGSIIALGLMWRKDPEAFNEASKLVAAIVGVLVAIGLLMTAASRIGDAKGMKAIGSSILMICLSLTLVVNAINKLMKMELPKDYVAKLTILGGIFLGLMALAAVLGLTAKIAGDKQLPKMASAIKSLAILLVATVLSLKMLFAMELPSDYGTKLAILGGIFTAFGAMIILMGAAARIAGGNGFKAAGTILSMAAFLVVVVAALYVLTLIPGDKMLKGAVALGGILVALAVSLAGASKITSEHTQKAILKMAILVGVVVAALAVLAMVPFSKLLKSTVALGSILLILAEDFKQVSKVTNGNTWGVVLTMVAAILAIAVSLYKLAEQPWENLLAAAVSMRLVFTAMGKVFKSIANAGDISLEKMGLFLLATTALIPIGIALYKLAEQPWEGMLASGAAVSAVLLSFSAVLKTISAMEDIKIDKIALFLLATVALAPIGVALYFLSEQPWEGMVAAGVALSAVLLALSGAFTIISIAKPNLASMATFLVATVSVMGIAYALYKLAEQPWEGLLASAASLSLVLVAMSAAMAICTLVGAVAPAAIVGIGLLDLFIANFALVLAALGAIFQSEGAKALISGGAEILTMIGQAIGDFVGAIINGVLSGISAALPKIAEDLSAFMENLQPFIAGSKNIDNGALASVGFLAGIILALTAVEIVNGIASLFGLSLVDVANELSDFMTALEPFIDQTKNLKEDSMRACGYLAEMILKITATELIAGIGKFLGISGNLVEFGEQLAEFGPSIKKFADIVKDVKPEAVQGAAAAAEIMAEVAKKLPAQDGLIQKIFGSKSLADFGEELVKFGPKIKTFSEQVKDVKPEAVQGAAQAAEIMATLADKLPPQDGLVQKIMGQKSLADFGDELTSFAKSIVPFCKKVAEVNPTAVSGVSVVTTIMTNLANNLPNTETLWNKLFGGGQSTLSGFGEELVAFGTSMSNFSNSVSGVDVEKINGAIEAFTALVNLSNTVQDASATGLVEFSRELSQIGTDSVDQFVLAFSESGSKAAEAVQTLLTSVNAAFSSGGTTMQSNAKTIGNNLCTGLINGINAKKPVTLSTIKNLCTAITNQFKTALPQSTLNQIGQNIVQGFNTGINAKKPVTLSTIKNLCTAITNQFKTALPQSTLNQIGQNIVTWLIQGMERKKSDVKYAVDNLCRDLIKAFKDNLTEKVFVEIGENAALGLKKGIENKITEIANAATKAAKQAVNSAKQALDEHSPSKVMAKVGEFFSLGFAKGIADRVRAIALASEKATDEAINPIKAAVDAITEIIDSGDFDVDPVIRPVVDLSDVQKSAKEIGSLMNKTYDLSSVRDLAMSASASFSRNRTARSENGSAINTSDGVNKYEFNQYNYSPKALTRSEIYRQTNNQFSAFRRAVNPT